MHAAHVLVLYLPLIEARFDRIFGRQELEALPDPGPEAKQSEYPDAVGCREASFSSPRWYLYDPSFLVYNYSTGGRTGSAGFAAANSANGKNFDCYAENINLMPNETQWYNCSIPNTIFSYNMTAEVFSIKESWSCDEDLTVTFTANASINMPLILGCISEQTDKGFAERCLYGNTALDGELTSPVNIKPYSSWLPLDTFDNYGRCDLRSDYPAWQVDNLVYDHTSREWLRFNLTNLSNGVGIACSLPVNETQTRSTAHAQQWLDCDHERPKTSPTGDVSGTKVLFDRDYGIFGLKQTWKCYDPPDPGSNEFQLEEPLFEGIVYSVISLDCTSNPVYRGSTTGDDTNYSCTLPSTNITGYAAYDFPPIMPHTWYTRSCLINSINSTSLILKDYEITKQGTTDTGLAQRGSFIVYNPGSGDEYEIRGVPIVDDGAWHACEAESLSWSLEGCEYRLDSKSDRIGFRIQWYCDDRDPYRPILFNATADGLLPKEHADATLVFSSLNWTSTRSSMWRGPQLPWV